MPSKKFPKVVFVLAACWGSLLLPGTWAAAQTEKGPV